MLCKCIQIIPNFYFHNLSTVNGVTLVKEVSQLRDFGILVLYCTLTIQYNTIVTIVLMDLGPPYKFKSYREKFLHSRI